MTDMMYNPLFYLVVIIALAIGASVPLLTIRLLAGRERNRTDSHDDPHLG